MFNVPFVSLIRHGKGSARLYISFSTNIGKDSAGVLQPLAFALAGSLVFKVFILQYILSDFKRSVVIDLT